MGEFLVQAKWIAILKLQGEISDGIQVILEWQLVENSQVSGTLTGRLAPNSLVVPSYSNWQRDYTVLEKVTRLELETDSGELYRLNYHPGQKQYIKQKCDRAAEEFQEHFNHWLNRDSLDFQFIVRVLAEKCQQSEGLHLLIRTDNYILQRLPWHCWNFWSRYPETLISLGPLEYERKHLSTPLKKSVRCLAILGNGKNIRLDIDKDLLCSVPGLDPSSLLFEQPSRSQVTTALKDECGWDLLFFGGHSRTEGEKGRLYINQQDSFSLDEIKSHLQNAINKGLKICILNSCDGLGLARYLITLQIPYVIYMREPVPDVIAHKFLEFFLSAYSQGNSIHHAFWDAQRSLEAIQDTLPYATWQPVLFQQPDSDPLFWPMKINMNHQRTFLRFRKKTILLVLFLVFLFLPLSWHWNKILFSSGGPKLGDHVSENEEILGAPHARKEHATKHFRKADHIGGIEQLLLAMEDYKNLDPETLIYLNNAILNALDIKSYTIAVTVPFLHSENNSQNYQLAYELLRGVAQAQTEANLDIITEYQGPGQNEADSDLIPNYGQLKDFLRINLPSKPIAKESGLAIDQKFGLKVIIADDFNIKEEALKRAHTLVDNSEVLGVVGHYASDMSGPTTDIYSKEHLPLISPGSTAKYLTENNDYFFRTVSTTNDEAKLIAGHILKEIDRKKAMVYYNPRSEFTQSFWEEFQPEYTDGGGEFIRKVTVGDPLSDIASEEFNPNKAIAALEESSQPNDTVIVLVPDGQVTDAKNNAIDLIAANQGKYPIVGSWGLDDPDVLTIVKEISEKGNSNQTTHPITIALPWHPLTSPNRNFLKNAENLWGKPVGALSALSYDATQVFLEIFRSQPRPTRNTVHSALHEDPAFNVEGATGTIAFTDAGDRKNLTNLLVQAQQCPLSPSKGKLTPSKGKLNSKWMFLPLDTPCPKLDNR